MKLEAQDVSAVLNLLTTLSEETGYGEMSLNQIRVLFLIALRDLQDFPIDSREIAKECGMSTSGVSRALSSLGKFGRGAREGLGLIEAFEDPVDRRRKPVTLTRKGLKVIEKLADRG